MKQPAKRKRQQSVNQADKPITDADKAVEAAQQLVAFKKFAVARQKAARAAPYNRTFATADSLQQGSFGESSYQYEPLPSTLSFRVMKLLPGQWTDTISIELEFASWDTPPKYEAISYAWGDPNNTKSCLCNRKKLLITISLYEALVHFRDSKKPRYLWADAVW